MYSPKDPTTITTLEELRDYVQDELAMVAQEFGQTRFLFMNPVGAAPDRPREGMLIYADGVHFNPGAGKGTYEYRSGVWQKL